MLHCSFSFLFFFRKDAPCLLVVGIPQGRWTCRREREDEDEGRREYSASFRVFLLSLKNEGVPFELVG